VSPRGDKGLENKANWQIEKDADYFRDAVKNGKKTLLTEVQITAIKLNLGKNSELPKTQLEKQLI
jgi:hypothetical protein